MLHKLKQQTQRYKLTASNRLPDRRARQFLANHIRTLRLEKTSPVPIGFDRIDNFRGRTRGFYYSTTGGHFKLGVLWVLPLQYRSYLLCGATSKNRLRGSTNFHGYDAINCIPTAGKLLPYGRLYEKLH